MTRLKVSPRTAMKLSHFYIFKLSLLVRLLLLFMWKQRLHCHTPHKSLEKSCVPPPATPVCSLQGLHGPHGEPRAEHGAAGEGRAGRDPGPAHLLHEEPRHQTESRPAGELHHQSAPEQPRLSSLTHLQTHIHTQIHVHTQRWLQGLERFFWGGTPFCKRWSGWWDSPLLPGKLQPLWEKLTSSGGVQRWATPRRRWGRQSFSRLPSNLSKCWCKRIASENPVGRDPCLRRKYIRMCQCVSCLWYLSELMCVEIGKSCVL